MIAADLIGNVVTPPNGPYAAIVGGNPSKGARSPKLWNAAFAAHGRSCAMMPLDVTAPGLARLLAALDDDRDFVGGAIAVPHKQMVARWLGDRVSAEAAAIGAVNCLFRRDGRLWGTNTDGEAARVCLTHNAGSLAGKSIVLLGPGGAGRAVAAFLTGQAARLILAGRDFGATKAYADAIGCNAVRWDALAGALAACDILVNCTSVGSAAAGTADISPLSDELMALLRPGTLIYDIIYDPKPTKLLDAAAQRGLPTFDGAGMNLEQAVLAYGHAMPGSRPAVVRAAMEKAAA